MSDYYYQCQQVSPLQLFRNGKLKQDIEGLKAEKDELNNALDDIKKELEKRRNEAEKHEKQSTLVCKLQKPLKNPEKFPSQISLKK